MSFLKTTAIQHLNASTPAINFDANGRVGIGVSSPSAKLHVDGTILSNRENSSLEGGQIGFCRSSDNVMQYTIDAYGSGTTPNLRFVDETAAAVRMAIDSSGRVTKPYQPAFRVTTTDNGSFTTGTIPWNTSIFNNGGHFSTSTYRFTAPVAGFYFFEAHTLSNRNTNTGDHGFDFYVNGSAVKRIYSGISGSASVHSEARGFVLLQLNVNDYVTTEMYGNAKTGIVGTPNHDQFSGYFLG